MAPPAHSGPSGGLRHRSRLGGIVVTVLLATVGVACSDDDGATDPGTPTTVEAGAAQDPELVALLVAADDLPEGFGPSEDVDDTVTSFCANEDAAAGLRASGRAIAGFTRQPAGASVIHLVFRFRDDDAARFVQQATDILGRCSNVPDAGGLAFEYSPPSDAIEQAMTGTDAHVARHGTSVGSGSLAVSIAVFHQGDLGHLVAVLAVDTDRPEVDDLALAAVQAAAG